jgi:hypothetical protein
MFNNKVLRKTFGLMTEEVTEHWTYLHNEEHEIQTKKWGGGREGVENTKSMYVFRISRKLDNIILFISLFSGYL